jgi:hypothetical protein
MAVHGPALAIIPVAAPGFVMKVRASPLGSSTSTNARVQPVKQVIFFRASRALIDNRRRVGA